MEIIVTALNKTSENYGINYHKIKPKIEQFLLGYVKDKEEKTFITYVPERVSYLINTDHAHFLRHYLGLDSIRSDTPAYLRQRRKYVEETYEKSSGIHEFLEKYEAFKFKYPEFSDNRALHYKKPWPEEKSKKKLVDGEWKTQYRWIREPKEELKELQTLAYQVITQDFHYFTNENTHSYTAKRSNITASKAHQASKHIVKTDIKNFFDSISPDFLKTSLYSLKEFAILQVPEDYEKVYNNFLHLKFKRYRDLTQKFVDAIIDIAQLKGGLPQGSPLSPVLSNIVMGKFDILIEKYCKSKEASEMKIMYTRYADDLTFSSIQPIRLDKLIPKINELLQDTPLKLHPDKTEYRKITQRCYILGVKLNKDHGLTYGHEKKEALKKDLFAALMDAKKGIRDIKENQELIGRLNYAKQIENEYIKNLIKKYARKFNIHPLEIFKHLSNPNKEVPNSPF